MLNSSRYDESSKDTLERIGQRSAVQTKNSNKGGSGFWTISHLCRNNLNLSTFELFNKISWIHLSSFYAKLF